MRLLIIRTSALGDVVHCLPVLTALRRHLPDAHVGWVIEASMAPLLRDHPDIDETIPVGSRPWRRHPFAAKTRAEVIGMIASLRRFRADAVLDLMGNHKAGVLARLSGCKRRIGLARQWRREPSSAVWINRPVAARGQHAVELALSVLDGLGLPAEPADFGAERLLPNAPATAAALVAEAPERLALIIPGTAWGNKTYPAERWGAVARYLAESAGMTTWVPAGPGEEAAAEAIANASNGAARALGLIDLPTLAALCRRAELVLGGDTGPTHLAHALGARVLQVMGPTDPERHGPYGSPGGALARRLPCSFCYRRFDGVKGCLLALTPALVAERALALLDPPPAPSMTPR